MTRWPRPLEWLLIHACSQAALTSALAPLFGNNPADMAPIGFAVGMLTGMPAYVAALLRRRSR